MKNQFPRHLTPKKNGISTIVLTFFMLAALAGTAGAGGLYVSEFGSPSMGTAGAGAQALADNASTAFHNPAGMTRLSGKQLMVTGGLLYSTVKFDPDADTRIPGNDGGDAGGPAPILGGFYAHSLSEDWKLGISVISISGAVLDYSKNWSGRYLIQDVTLLTVTVNPTAAYRVNDWLSFGGGPTIMYASLDEQLAAPPPNGKGKVEIDGDDFAFGFTLGSLIEFNPHTRFGIGYQSKVEPEFSGDIKISPPGIQAGVDTDLTFPQAIRTSIYHELNQQWALLGSVAWEDWSDLENINISGRRGSVVIPRNWKDTYKFAAGVHYRPSETWLLQAGIAYDTSPVDSDDRTPDMPIDRQIRYATGAQYKWKQDVSLGGQFVYADYGKAKIRNALLKGDYERNDIFFFSMNLNWKF
jgi:long-chain fatty acid transport protein